jgi:hypothetical protein
MLSPILCFFILMCLPDLVLSEFFSVSSNRYPYLYLTNPASPVIWHTKFFALRQASSQGIRINARGVRFIPAAYSTMSLSENIDTPGSLSVLRAGGVGDLWNVANCTMSTESLCKLETDTSTISRLFPNQVHIEGLRVRV